MKTISILSFVLIFALSALGQERKPVEADNKNIRVIANRNGSTSELLPIPISAGLNLKSAKIGLKYFGVEDESNISFVLILEGTKSFYSNGDRYGVQLLADDVPINKNRFRAVEAVIKNGSEEVLRMHLTTEELAWLAGAEKVSLSIFSVETERKHHTLVFTPTAFRQFKAFAKTVYAMRSEAR